MPRFGTVKRQYPLVRVLRGYDPMEPHVLSQAYPVADGVTVLSGQVVSLVYDTAYEGDHKWVLGWTAGIPYIAINDWVPGVGTGLGSDADVMEAGKLPALSSAGQFEIQTPFWADSSNALQTGGGAEFVLDAPVGPAGTSGSIKVVALESGIPIMGYVTRNRGPLSLGNKVEGGITYPNSGVNSSAIAANSTVVTFQTAYAPNSADAGA